jgi:hypothetical protein
MQVQRLDLLKQALMTLLRIVMLSNLKNEAERAVVGETKEGESEE